ncbi:MAG: T9SS type A sorting domain-containing protein, partial [Candidatus Kapabacteria bacterium]|nr:T9SS type A sorting domain-containing protein [Candidatus Kapabacteria bacterium]
NVTYTVVSVQNAACAGTISGASSVTLNVASIPTTDRVMHFDGNDITSNSNNKVTQWNNIAGSGSNYPDGFVNTTLDACRPTEYANYSLLNGNGAMYFDGGDKPVDVAVNTGSGISGGTQKTWFMLYRPTSSGLSNNRMVIYKQGDENHGFIVYLINRVMYYGAWNNQNCSGTCTNKWSVFHNTGFTVQPGTNYLLQFVYNGNASSSNRMRFSINGTMYTPSSTPGTSMDYSGDAVSIGGKTGNTRFHDAASVNESNQYPINETKIAEVLLYNTASSSVRNQAWCVLRSKYNLSIGDNPIGTLAKTLTFSNDDEEPVSGNALRTDYTLTEAYPNPASDFTNFTLTLDEQQFVRMTILNDIGQEIMVLHNGVLARRTPNGFTVATGTLPSGTYILHVQGENFSTLRKFVVVR